MRPLIALACSLPLLSSAAFAQHLISFGIKGGVPLTDAFSDNSVLIAGVSTIHTYSSSKNYVVGGMLELNLPLGFSVEADALYRPLNLTTDIRDTVPNTLVHASADIRSGEFPILGKYHFFHLPLVRPYVEAGPVFRSLGASASYLSGKGIALGGGVDIKLPLIRISPEIRFTRWGQDGTFIINNALAPPSNLNQAEFLIGVSF